MVGSVANESAKPPHSEVAIPATWAEYDREVAGIAAEMMGAHDYFTRLASPEYATAEHVAEAFTQYAERMAAVPKPS